MKHFLDSKIEIIFSVKIDICFCPLYLLNIVICISAQETLGEIGLSI